MSGVDRWPTSRAVLTAAVLAVVLLLAASAAVLGAPTARAAGPSAETPLVNDSSGAGLLDPSVRLAPGRAARSCVLVAGDGSIAAGPVHVGARELSGGLADHLLVRVEVGTGGDRRDCGAFRGTTVWEGRLTALAATPVDTGWRPAPHEGRTFRFTVTVDPAAPQGATAQAVITWQGSYARFGEPPGPTPPGPTPTGPPPAPGPSPTTAPDPATAPDPSVAPDPAAGAPGAAPAPPAPPAPSPAPGPPAGPAPSGGPVPGAGAPRPAPAGDGSPAQVAGSPAVTRAEAPVDRGLSPAPGGGHEQPPPAGPDGGSAGEGPAAVADPVGAAGPDVEMRSPWWREHVDPSRAGETLRLLARSSALPLSLLLLVGGFLLVQHRLDAADPKLALAPVHAPYLVFDDPDQPPA